jgi:hypothetical protein
MQAYASTKKWVTGWLENLPTAALSLSAGTTWSGWKKCFENTTQSQQQSSKASKEA